MPNADRVVLLDNAVSGFQEFVDNEDGMFHTDAEVAEFEASLGGSNNVPVVLQQFGGSLPDSIDKPVIGNREFGFTDGEQIASSELMFN